MTTGRPWGQWEKTALAIEQTGVKNLCVSGGVACNSELRAQAEKMAKRCGLELAIPEPRLCTDNGAMIAAAGAMLSPMSDFAVSNADSDLKMESLCK